MLSRTVALFLRIFTLFGSIDASLRERVFIDRVFLFVAFHPAGLLNSGK